MFKPYLSLPNIGAMSLPNMGAMCDHQSCPGCRPLWAFSKQSQKKLSYFLFDLVQVRLGLSILFWKSEKIYRMRKKSNIIPTSVVTVTSTFCQDATIFCAWDHSFCLMFPHRIPSALETMLWEIRSISPSLCLRDYVEQRFCVYELRSQVRGYWQYPVKPMWSSKTSFSVTLW